jgi:hypothetical protein
MTSWRMMTFSAMAFLPAVALAAHHTVVIAGLGGEPTYEQRFVAQADEIEAAAATLASAPEHVVKLSGPAVTRDSVRNELRALAKRATENDVVTVVFIGHGTYDGEEYRFNIPGPDLTGGELLTLLDDIKAREQLIVNTTSASGVLADRWMRPGRVVITATKSGGERTATRFAHYWAQAVRSNAADANKDGIVTAREAFDYASREVAAAFKADVALATEHSRIEGGEQAGGLVVARLDESAIVSNDPEVRALLAQRDALERELSAVKSQRDELATDAYYDALEEVLVKFARLQRQIDARLPPRGSQ